MSQRMLRNLPWVTFNVKQFVRMEKLAGTPQICYYHFDALGSVTDLSNNVGGHIEHYVYSPFGKTKIYDPATGLKRDDSIIGNYYRFTARQWDPESSLYYYRARYYDANLGRFLQADPAGYSADINLYRYCRNNPIIYLDAYGLYVAVGFEGPGGLNPFGHSFIRVNNDVYEIGRTENHGRKDIIRGTEYKEYMKKYATPGHGEQEIPMSKAQEKKLSDNLNKTVGKPYKYLTMLQNCGDFTEKELDKIGIHLPVDPITFPADTFAQAKKYYEEHKMDFDLDDYEYKNNNEGK